MASGGVGGSISAATDVLFNSPAQDDLLIRGSSGRWVNTAMLGKVAQANNGGRETVYTPASSLTADTTLDLANGNIFNVTLAASVELTFSGATTGRGCSFTLYLRQDATGGRVVSWGSTIKWSGGAPVLSTGINAIDILVFESIDGGTTWFGSLVGTNFV